MLPKIDEIEEYIDYIISVEERIKEPQILSDNSVSGRRAMVNKLWYRDVARKLLFKKEDPPHSRVFSEPKCQPHAASWFLVYRWLIFLAWATIIVCSIAEIGSYKPLYQHDKWFIYLTNWDLMLGLSQALLGGILASRRWKMQRITDFDPSTLKLGSMERVYWFLYVVTTNIAIAVTIIYWVSVYNPKTDYMDPLNILLHICNSILMIIDFCITNIPFRFRNFWWTLTLAFSYIIFSIVYYLAGGLDKNGFHYIYKILDWKKPMQTLAVCVGETILVTFLHFFTCILHLLKDVFYSKFILKSRKPPPEVNTFATERQSDIV